MHQYVPEVSYGDDEVIIEYIECDSQFVKGVDLRDSSQRKIFLTRVQSFFDKRKKTNRLESGYFFRKLRHTPFGNSKNLYVTTIIGSQFQTNEVVDHNNSYGEKSHRYASMNNLKDIYFTSNRSNVEFVIKQRENELIKLTEGSSLTGGPGKSFVTLANGMVNFMK